MLGFLDSNRGPPPRWEGSVIYADYVKQIRLGVLLSLNTKNLHLDGD